MKLKGLPGRFFFVGLIIFWSHFAYCGIEDEKPLVVFFGGGGFSKERAELWAKKASAQNNKYDYMAYEFKGPWDPKAKVVENNKESLAKALKFLRVNKGRKIYVVGHSSGSSSADELIKRASTEGLISGETATEIILDGFYPRSGFKPRECWTTENQAAPNWNPMTYSCGDGGSVRKTKASHCKDVVEIKQCLHMSLVNNGFSYDSPNVNLEWLPPVLPRSSLKIPDRKPESGLN